ncbi:MAG: thiamine phosphate synthase [Clostridiales bacterium]|nr:thiamine phosphate synthase [Clostridiales bacterium]MBS5877631.1 thiamine phosphate synthase [Clostridiales bacterium]MDU0939482.1 thiamine phosphate synthase [Clostridiales bacterium]MDU1042014.1 thiamine phosphate synthase [Clostridiales bacterium]MDU3490939.1 thiamine phosphate synthase [Clostridiales bacterium]
MTSRKDIFKDCPIYGMTAEDLSFSHDNIKDVEEMLKAGVKVIQYREKEKTGLYVYEQCLKIREMTKAYGAVFIIDDFVDICIAVKADGVHIGQDDIPLKAVRNILGPEYIIGLSTHSPAQAEAAAAMGADYIGVGPIYATKTKKNVCAPVGLDYLDYVAANINIPFVAIGGIKPHNLGEVYRHGAKTACLVTGIVGSDNIGKTLEELSKIYDENAIK